MYILDSLVYLASLLLLMCFPKENTKGLVLGERKHVLSHCSCFQTLHMCLGLFLLKNKLTGLVLGKETRVVTLFVFPDIMCSGLFLLKNELTFSIVSLFILCLQGL